MDESPLSKYFYFTFSPSPMIKCKLDRKFFTDFPEKSEYESCITRECVVLKMLPIIGSFFLFLKNNGGKRSYKI